MYDLFSEHYELTTRKRFEADLDEKQDVILLEETASGTLRGFSTQRVYTPEELGERCWVVYSGDTVIDRAFWGQKALQVGMLAYLIRLQWRHPTTPVYWLLTTKGYKTYLLLTNYFPAAWPRVDAPTPPHAEALMRHLGALKFGSAYDPTTGLVRTGQDRVRSGVADLRPEDRKNPHIDYFARRNPGHADGDELLCLAHIRLRDPPLRLIGIAARRRRRG